MSKDVVALGVRLLAISALKVIVSVSASPNTMSPSADIFPVACIFPVTFKLEFTLIAPTPLGLNSKFALPVSYTHLTLPTNREV